MKSVETGIYLWSPMWVVSQIYSPQIQGQEIFRCQQRVMGLREEYKLIRETMAWADEYIEAERGNYYQRKAEVGAIVGLFLAMLAAAVAFLQMAPSPEGVENLWQRIFSMGTVNAMVLTVALGLCLWLGVKCRQSAKYARKRLKNPSK